MKLRLVKYALRAKSFEDLFTFDFISMIKLSAIFDDDLWTNLFFDILPNKNFALNLTHQVST